MRKIIFLFSLLFFVQPVLATDYYIDSNISDGGNGSFSNPWNNIDDINYFASNTGFKPGDHIKLKKGNNYSGNLYINKNSGNINNDIIYESYGDGNLPHINGMVIISGQKYITVQNMEILSGIVGVKIKDEDGIPASNIKILNNKIHDYIDSGINIEGGGLNNISIFGNEIFNGSAGVYVSSDTGDDYPDINKKNNNPIGCNNSIKNNTIYNNKKNGIGINAISLKEYSNQFICDGSSFEKGRNIVQGNTVKDNGGYGIEIDSNHILVEHNTFTNNGISSSYGGCSGIHLFDRWASESGIDSDKYERGGDYNIIRYNISKENKDRQFNRTDGNGIQLDMWCDHNQVYNNIAYNNDGAGIIVYGSSYNEIYNNTLYNNGQDVGKRFGANEMVIISADVDNKSESDVINNEGVYKLVSKMNIIRNNIGMATKTDNSNNPNYGFIDCRYGDCRYALAVDDYAINDVGNIGNNIFSNNLWFNNQKENQAVAIIKVSNNEHFQIPIGSTSLDLWNSNNGVQNENMGNPSFVDINNMNFHLQNISPAIDNGKTISLFNDDFDEIKRPQGVSWDIGAFENIKSTPTPTLTPTPTPTPYKYLNKTIIKKIDKKISEIKGNKAKVLILLVAKVKKNIKEEKNETKKEIYQELVTYLTLMKKQIENSYYK